MRVYTGLTPGDVYLQQLHDLLEAPEVVVKGRTTRELLDVVTVIERPWQRWQRLVPGRRLNPWLVLSEALWFLAGRNDVAALEPYNRNIKQFSDDGLTLYGAYGHRIKEQLPLLIDRLLTDPNDRRAVLSIWQPADLTAITADPPCNDLVMFKLRQRRLHMSVHCRSNDLHWGLHAVNLPVFGMLQEYITCRLNYLTKCGYTPGQQVHYSNSLHIYMDGPQLEITKNMLVARQRNEGTFLFASNWHPLFGELGELNEETMAEYCSMVLDNRFSAEPDELIFLQFASDFLACYRTKYDSKQVDDLQHCRYAEHFMNWVQAGKEFLNG